MSSTSQGRLLGFVLVALQGVIFLAVGISAFADGPAIRGSWWAGSTLVLLGGLGMFWAGKDLGRALTPMPTPNGAGLSATGIYGYVRHPMYAAIIAIALGLAIGSGRVWTYAFALLLAVFFEAKTRVEEGFLASAYAGYADYASRTGKFLPGLGKRRA
ncbi:isoprenylcysteine carboxylmethyltransferase family protein [Demequina sp.]|uniref:methyltransferase family protein n=1 Tax=Demequina sp. TaxID=2050685 RepID=UPI0025FD2791|nr:isoprenylcysteine carboxylmethyltransferase family protein [Demequina sp.]